jgi:CBS domain-containing protein
MTSDPEYLSEEATIAWALNRMDVGGFRHIPIVKHGKPFKVVSVKDILKHLASHYCGAA